MIIMLQTTINIKHIQNLKHFEICNISLIPMQTRFSLWLHLNWSSEPKQRLHNRLNGPGFESQQGQGIFVISKMFTSLGPTQLLIDWVPEKKRPRRDIYIPGGSNMTGTDLCVNKPHCAATVRPWESEATTSTLPPAPVRTCSVLSGSC